MAAITPAPKLLRHLGSSLVLVQTGRTRGFEEVAREEEHQGVQGGWWGSGVGVGLGEVMY